MEQAQVSVWIQTTSTSDYDYMATVIKNLTACRDGLDIRILLCDNNNLENVNKLKRLAAGYPLRYYQLEKPCGACYIDTADSHFEEIWAQAGGLNKHGLNLNLAAELFANARQEAEERQLQHTSGFISDEII